MSTPNTIPRALAALGLTMTVSQGRYVPAAAADGGWSHVVSHCAVVRNGREIWAGPFRQGIACLVGPKDGPDRAYTPSNRSLWAEEKRARLKGWRKPTLPDVFCSLLLDGAAYFDHESFEEWCGNFGYDTDSRKAEATYRACCDTGRRLARAFTHDELESLRDLFQDY